MKKIFYNTVKAVLVTVLLLMAMAVIVPVFVCDQFRIGGHSMDPTLEAGDHILVNKLLFGARSGREISSSSTVLTDVTMTGSVSELIMSMPSAVSAHREILSG